MTSENSAVSGSFAPEELDALARSGAEQDAVDAPPPAPGEAPAPEPPKMPTDQVCEFVLTPLFGILCPNWNLQQSEIRHLSEAYAAVIDKYFPDLDFGPELGALVVTVAILGPRMKTPRKLEKPPVEATKEPAP